MFYMYAFHRHLININIPEILNILTASITSTSVLMCSNISIYQRLRSSVRIQGICNIMQMK